MSEVTKILNEIELGNAKLDDLVPVIYDELRSLAKGLMSRERDGHTLNGTSLVHEAYIKIGATPSFESRRHFFAGAAQAMRRILIDHARSRDAVKRGGDMDRIHITMDRLVDPWIEQSKFDSLDKAIDKLEQQDPVKAELVKLRYFTGLKIHEAAEVLGISTATADRYWAYAKAWLQAEMN